MLERVPRKLDVNKLIYLVPLQVDANVRIQKVTHVVSGDVRNRQLAVVHLVQQILKRNDTKLET